MLTIEARGVVHIVNNSHVTLERHKKTPQNCWHISKCNSHQANTMSKVSRESYIKMIAEVMELSEKTYLSQNEIYEGIYRKWPQFSNMKSYGWKNKIDHVLMDNEFFEHNDSWNWKLHPIYMEMMRTGKYSASDVNNYIKLSRQSGLNAKDIEHCSQRKDNNKRLVDSPLAQHKKQRLAVASTSHKDESAAGSNGSTVPCETSSDFIPAIDEPSSSTLQHQPGYDEQHPHAPAKESLMLQESTDINPNQVLDATYGHKDQEHQCLGLTSAASTDVIQQQHTKAEMLTQPSTEEDDTLVAPYAVDAWPVALFQSRVNKCYIDLTSDDEQQIESVPTIDTTEGQHDAPDHQPQHHLEEEDSVPNSRVIDIRPVESFQAIVDACGFDLTHNDNIYDHQLQGVNVEQDVAIRHGVSDIRPIERFQAIADACVVDLTHDDSEQTVEAIETEDDDNIYDHQLQGINLEEYVAIRHGVIDIRPIRMFNSTIYEFVNLW